ncbi:hypothetical protein WMY93_032192 [Mugilogobius chulae]|uniref:THAP-type domain-containing protein n=1 Tax=Mugilogobius chulae TaxID=88201 RepID=A0AAW0MJ82_9GOBI
MICDAHFKKEDYLSSDLMAMEMGFKSRNNVRLIEGAVPSVHASSLLAAAAATTTASGRSTSASTKRWLFTTLSEESGALQKEALLDLDQENGLSSDPLPLTVDQALQCNIKVPYRSSGVQVQPKTRSVGTQTDEVKPLTSTPVKVCHYEDDKSSLTDFDSHQLDSSWSIEEEEMDSEISEEEVLEEDCRDHRSADKFIVCEAQLLSLFSLCPTCCEETQGKIIRQEGTFIKIQQICSACGLKREWQNQPKLHKNMPLCNLMISGAIHFSGCMPTQALRMLNLLGVQCISVRTFFRHQQLYTIPTVTEAWKTKQADILDQLKEMDGGLILSGDCRSDSPGHCAKYGTYTVIEERINKVVDLQLVQSSEVPNSTWAELEGLKRTVNFLTEQKMHVSTLVTDRNRQVAKWVRETLCPGGTKHFFDIWHVSKGLKKSLDASSKERNCEDLNLWKQAIINHLYWTAASTPDGNPDVLEAKWTSLVGHVQDIHEHENPWFPVCAHPTLEGEARHKQWLQPGSMAAIKLENVATRQTFVKDVRQLSPSHQTFSLEAFHALILHFAPKHTGFSFLGMYSRLLLAALHYNQNSSREVARNPDGEVRYAVRYPRFRKGGWVVRPIKENPSYEYAFALMEDLQQTYTRCPQELKESSAVLSSCAPKPLSASFQKVAKDDAIGQYRALHSRFPTK